MIRGNTVGTTIPRTNYNQTNPTKADYLKGKEVLDAKIQNAQTAADNAQTAADNAHTAAQTGASNALSEAKKYTNEQVVKASHNGLVVNGYFRDPVNTSGKTSFTSNGETIKKWFLDHTGDSGVSLSENGITFNVTSKMAILRQPISKEDRKKLIGKTVTVVAQDSNGNIALSSGVVPDFGGSLDSAQNAIAGTNVKINLYTYSTLEALYIRLICSSASSPVTIEWVELYVGQYTADTLPLYQPKGRKVEELNCGVLNFHKEVTLTASGWSGSAPYTQTIAVEGITEDDKPHWGLVYSGDTNSKLAQKEAFAMVDDLDTSNGSVTFTCLSDKPATNITIQMEVNR